MDQIHESIVKNVYVNAWIWADNLNGQIRVLKLFYILIFIYYITGGHLFSWGNNSHGQLGIGTLNDQYEPCLVSSLQGVPFALINAGAQHTFALTLSGALFGWGNNE